MPAYANQVMTAWVDESPPDCNKSANKALHHFSRDWRSSSLYMAPCKPMPICHSRGDCTFTLSSWIETLTCML